MSIVWMFLELFGGLAMFMYGMGLTSEGIQRAAGDRLQRAVDFMTRNRLIAVVTGAVVTVLVQSSSATSVMVISFVNAGLLSLVQSIGVLLGANIGTTLTAWIIAAVGIGKFSIAIIAVPAFGAGFFMSIMRKRSDSFRSYGEALMGFAMIFMGLGVISGAIPKPSGDFLLFLQKVSNLGPLAVVISVLVGTAFTILIDASSATLAIVISLAAEGVIDFPMAAGITLGANIGTTFNAFIASLAPNISPAAKRTAWAHILLKIFGTLWVLVVLNPFLKLVDWITPGEIGPTTVGAHIAMLHTMFNVANALVVLPFARQFAGLLERTVRVAPPAGTEARAALTYLPQSPLATPELSLLHARKETAEMAGVARSMFARFRADLASCPEDLEAEVEWFRRHETYADEMEEELSRFLLEITRQAVGEKTQGNIQQMLHVIDELENVTDSCMSLSLLLERCGRKERALSVEELAALGPYTLLAEEFMRFVSERLGGPIDDGALATAADYETRIDAFRKELKKSARKRMQAGADIKTEFLFVDMVRHIEKIGDYTFSVAEALREMR